MPQGIFITFEGTEGAGKSTLIRTLARRLGRLGCARLVVTREPGGPRLSERIRELILAEAMDPWTELFLYQAARAEHLARTVRPALRQGRWVLCDRFTDSTLAYQAHARGLPWSRVHELNQAATQGLVPRLTIWLDIDPARGLRSARTRTRFEAEGVAFQAKVRRGYAKARREDPRRWLRLDARSGSPDELAERIIAELRTRRLLKRAGR